MQKSVEVEQPRDARDWVQVLAKYREPSTFRSIWELVATLVPAISAAA